MIELNLLALIWYQPIHFVSPKTGFVYLDLHNQFVY